MAEVDQRPPGHYLVVDLEATTSSDGSLPEDEMETIEIGAVLVDAQTLDAVAEFQSFVRPLRHPQLLPFCTQLTHITQEMVDAAPRFPVALAELAARLISPYAGNRMVFASWGHYDRIQIERDCAFHGIANPMPPHLNLKQQFSLVQGKRKRYGLTEALARCDLVLQGIHHRGIDDARNTVRLLPWIVGERRLAKPQHGSHAAPPARVDDKPK